MSTTKRWPVYENNKKKKKALKIVLDYAMNPEKTTEMEIIQPTQKADQGKAETEQSAGIELRAEEKEELDELQKKSSLEGVLSYIQNPKKTLQRHYVTGIYCSADTSEEEFEMVKELHGKQGGITAYHGYQSFADYDDVTPELAHQIGVEFAKQYWGDRFQVVVTTHLNTHCIHNHFVINSISFVDGKRLQGKEKAWFIFRKVSDDICRRHGLTIVESPQRNPNPKNLERADQEGRLTRYNLARAAIDEAIKKSENLYDFRSALQKMGYHVKINDNIKYWTIIPKEWNKPIRMYRLGEDYTNDRIRERIMDNVEQRYQEYITRQQDDSDLTLLHYQENAVIQTRKQVEDQRKHVTSKTRNQGTGFSARTVYIRGTGVKRKKVGRMRRLYLYYLYRMGYLPKYSKKRMLRTHYLLKDDLMKIDQFSREMQFLGRYKINTISELMNYKEQQMIQLSELEMQRKKIRNVLRREETEEGEEQLIGVRNEIRGVKKKILMCNNIEKRSEKMKNKLDIIRSMEQMEKVNIYQKSEKERREKHV